MKTKVLFLASMAILGATALQAQLNVGSTGAPDASAILQLSSSSKGLRLPNIALSTTTTFSLTTATSAPAAVGMTVYNTTAAITSSDANYPAMGIGAYTWDGTGWLASKSAAANNIYTNDGTLGSSRTVTQGAFPLTFSGTANNNFIVTNSVATFPVVANFITPNVAAGSVSTITFGKTSSVKNEGNISFGYVGAANDSNNINFGFNGVGPILTTTAGGRVGIGTTTPSNTLDVNGTTRMRANATGTTSDYLLTINPTTGLVNQILGSAYIGGVTGFWNLNAGNIYNNNGAKVGIGTSTPLTDLNIQQTGTGKGISLTGASVDGSSDNTGGVSLVLGHNSTGNRQMWTGDLTGLGLSRSTFTRTQVTGSPTSTTDNQIVSIDATAGDGLSRRPLNLGVLDAAGGVMFGNPLDPTPAKSFLWNSSNMAIGTAYHDAVAPANGLLVQGNVGIGTTAPYSQLANTDINTTGSDGRGGNTNTLTWSAAQAGYAASFYNGGGNSASNGLAVKIDGTFSSATALDVSKGTQSGAATPLFVVKGGGNVGIGTNAPTAPLTIVGSTAPNTGGIVVSTGAVTSGLIYAGTANVNATAMASEFFSAQSAGPNYLSSHTAGTADGTNFMQFFLAGSPIGSVSQATASSVAFNTTSDIRLKENIRPTGLGLADLMKIQVSDYNYKADKNVPQTGFLAQQLYTVFPVAVTKGGLDAKTNPWQVDYSKLTPLLTKAIQELNGTVVTQAALAKKQQTEIALLKKDNQTQVALIDRLSKENQTMAAHLTDIKEMKTAMLEMRKELNTLAAVKLAATNTASK